MATKMFSFRWSLRSFLLLTVTLLTAVVILSAILYSHVLLLPPRLMTWFSGGQAERPEDQQRRFAGQIQRLESQPQGPQRQTQHFEGQPPDSREQTQRSEGQLQDSRGRTQRLEGQPQDSRGQIQRFQGQSQDSEGQTQGQSQNFSAEQAGRDTLVMRSAGSNGSGYDVEEVSRWYRGSVCSGRGGEFVGDQPLFPPCASDIPSGVATWGQFPYLDKIRFLNSSKNPCWEQKGQIRCVPYFYLIGVSKSGTSDLFRRLISHPQVGRSLKEPHFFDRWRYSKRQRFEAYVGHYKTVAKMISEDILNQGHSSIICGDASPSYFYDNYHWKMYSGNEHCTEPRVISASHIYHLNPDVKIVMIIRHPVDRLYSRYLFDHRSASHSPSPGPPSPQKFHTHVVESLTSYQDCFRRWSLRHCVYNETLFMNTPKIRVQENLYPVFLEDWLRVVPRDQFVFLRFEDYRQDMGKELRKVFRFLGLENLSEKQLEAITASHIYNQGKLVHKTDPMLPETRRILEEFYQPFIRRFAAILNDEKFLWADLSLK